MACKLFRFVFDFFNNLDDPISEFPVEFRYSVQIILCDFKLGQIWLNFVA